MDLWSNNFIDEVEQQLFEDYLRDPSGILLEMANVRGLDVKLEGDSFPFSFYFSSKSSVRGAHAIRATVLWNPSKMPKDADGYMELHGSYAYISGSHKYQPTGRELKAAREFFKKYKVLFAAVWEEKLCEGYLGDYFEGKLKLHELLSKFEDLKERQYYDINHCKTLAELEDCVRRNKVFSMND